jgi:hypothetical protein
VRTFLGWVLLVAILGAIAFVVAPVAVRPLVVDAVRAASPFGSAPLDVEVSIDPVGLLRGTIERIHITGVDVQAGGAAIGALDVTATNVAIGDHSFDSIEGSLTSVVITRADGSTIDVDRVDLSGPPTAVDATATISHDAAIALVRGALAEAGLPTDEIDLIEGGVRLQVLGQRTDVAIGVVDGSLTIAGALTGGQVGLFGPATGDPWRLAGVAITPDGLQVRASLDLDQALNPPR